MVAGALGMLGEALQKLLLAEMQPLRPEWQLPQAASMQEELLRPFEDVGRLQRFYALAAQVAASVGPGTPVHPSVPLTPPQVMMSDP